MPVSHLAELHESAGATRSARTQGDLVLTEADALRPLRAALRAPAILGEAALQPLSDERASH